jgi:hypothetical protein
MIRKITKLTAAVLMLILISHRTFSANPPDEGMWLPLLVERLNYVDMQKMGLHLTAEELYNINHSSLKDAIVGLSNGGANSGFFCTAEVVSAQGLLFTNHHCGYNAVQSHSSTENDYLTNGFWAKKYDEELPNEGMSASFLIRMENVTDSVIPFLSDTLKESMRSEKVRELTSKMKKRASEGGKYEVSVKSFYGGNEYYLFVFKTYKDVRLVGAPPSSIGKFGGDTDNWMWPRHTGDFSILRIYGDSVGEPADYDKSNKPINASYHLPISMKGIKKDDFAMIWGYPGSTSRYLTTYGVEYNMNTFYPTLVDLFGKELEVMKKRMDVDKKVKIDYAADYAGIANTWKNFIGQMKMLRKNKVVLKKKAIEDGFIAWYNADPSRKQKYGNVLTDLKKGYEDLNKVAVPFFYANLAGMNLQPVGLASQFSSLKTALEKKDKDAIKDAIEIQKGVVEETFKATDPIVEKNKMSEMLKMYKNNVPASDLPSFFTTIALDYKGDIDAYVNDLYANSIFATREKAEEFLEKPSLKKMEKDPVYKMYQSVQENMMKYIMAYREGTTTISASNRLFIGGLREMNPDQVRYPDANSTMRMSYGKVLDYYPADAVYYNYFTTLKGVMEKEDPTNDEFIVEKKLKDLFEAKDYGPYGDNGEMITCFLTTNDITGGNSGSPVINGDGQLIGLAFDGNWEAMSGDIMFEPDLQRTINVDIRYVLFIIDKFAGANNLINELTLVK